MQRSARCCLERAREIGVRKTGIASKVRETHFFIQMGIEIIQNAL